MNDFIARDPRHPSTGIRVEVRRSPGGVADSVDAVLVNLSREGFQLRLPTAAEKHDTVVMKITAPEQGVDVMFPADVRWCREGDGDWLVGCKTNWQVDLETLGELFLNEILVADALS